MSNVGTEAATPQDASLISFSFSLRVNGLLLVLGAGLVLRLLLALLPGFAIDIGTFQAWSGRLAQNGPWNFYAPDYFSDYAPGYLYVLWFIGELNQALHFSPDVFEYVLKLPSIAADMGSAYVLYLFLEGQRKPVRLLAAAIYLLFPAALLIGPIWGQVDSLSAFFLMLSLYAINKRRPAVGTAAYVVSFMIKPQMIAVLPFLALWIMRQNPPRKLKVSGFSLPAPPALWWRLGAVGVAVLFAMTLPFFPHDPWNAIFGGLDIPLTIDDRGLIAQLQDSANVYKYNSINAYNLWGISGFFKPDDGQFLGIPQPTWGILLFLAAVGLVLFSLRQRRETWALALGSALCLLAFDLFLTRMHERYLFPVFLPLLAACVLARDRLLWGSFAALGVLHLLNLYFVYSYYPFALPREGQAPREPFMKPLYDWLADGDFLGKPANEVLSAVTTLFFPVLLAGAYYLASRRKRKDAAPQRTLQTEGT